MLKKPVSFVLKEELIHQLVTVQQVNMMTIPTIHNVSIVLHNVTLVPVQLIIVLNVQETESMPTNVTVQTDI